MQEYNQPTNVPVPKIKAGIVAAAVVSSLISLLALFGIVVPQELSAQAEASLTGLIILVSLLSSAAPVVAGYIKKDVK